MFFKPPSTLKMWDTWMYSHQGRYYLYYLVTEHSPGEGVWLSSSNDGVLWQEHGLVLKVAQDAQWLGTGAVWPSKVMGQEHTFVMNFSEWRGPEMLKGQQTIFFATSTDLIHWTRLDKHYEFAPDARWYAKDQHEQSRWDCIYPLEKEGGYWGYWTANPKAFYPGFGFGETLDGLNWQALPPPQIEWGDIPVLESLEFGAIARVNERYYAMLGCYPLGGMFLFVADAPQGPFKPAQHNFNFLVSPRGHRMAYFSRFFPTPDALLVNHHVITRQDERFFAPLKTAVLGPEGELWLGYWSGNEVAKGERLSHVPRVAADAGFSGVRLIEPTLPANGSFIECTLSNLVEGWVGLYLEYAHGLGTVIRVGAGGVVEMGSLSLTSIVFEQEDRIERGVKAQTYQARLLVRGSLLEVYLNDRLVQCFSLLGRVTGRLGVLLDKTSAVVDDLSIYPMRL